VASFNGNSAIMGLVLEMHVIPYPVRHQLDSFGGITGRTAQWLGGDGGRTEAILLIVAVNAAARITLENAWRTYQQLGSTAVYSLVDDEGTTWTNVFVAGFEPLEPPRYSPGQGASRLCRVTFEHLA
jgi:hypothetical protein